MRLSIVAPCYNEEEILDITVPRLVGILDMMKADSLVAPESFILLVDDGSSDNTWNIISRLAKQYQCIKAISFSTNEGHQNAILAGMIQSIEPGYDADAVITIDVDLQDDPLCIPKMVKAAREGAEIVYVTRGSRESDSFFKRVTAESFYKVQSSLGLKTIFNHADYRLMSRFAIEQLMQYQERNLYLRGIIPLIGLPSATISETRAERVAGSTKYTLSKMLRLATDGITSFSVKPIYMIMGLGGVFVLIAIIIGIYVMCRYFAGEVVLGWTSMMLSIWFVGGFILIALGLVGLYVGRVYIETKQRPRYHIHKKI